MQMSAWIETNKGSLVKADSLIISIRQAQGSANFEVVVNAGPCPAVFAPGLKDEALAQRIRNSLALHVDRAETAPGSTLISFANVAQAAVQSSLMED
jgi:hypothetical protein